MVRQPQERASTLIAVHLVGRHACFAFRMDMPDSDRFRPHAPAASEL